MNDFDGNMLAELKYGTEQAKLEREFNLSEAFEDVTFRDVLDAISESSYQLQRELVLAVRDRDNLETGFVIDNMVKDWLE